MWQLLRTYLGPKRRQYDDLLQRLLRCFLTSWNHTSLRSGHVVTTHACGARRRSVEPALRTKVSVFFTKITTKRSFLALAEQLLQCLGWPSLGTVNEYLPIITQIAKGECLADDMIRHSSIAIWYMNKFIITRKLKSILSRYQIKKSRLQRRKCAKHNKGD